jgi:TolB-like protein/cytochrome c-type biogenesis protein CcmH/NrfG
MSEGRSPGLVNELKRRGVVRVAAAYLVGSWLIIQIADTVFPYLGISDTAVTRVIALLGIGFLPALIFSWVFEWTPEGLRRDSDLPRAAPRPRSAGRKFDYAIIVMLTIAVAIFAYDRFVRPIGSAPVTVIANQNPAIAVLPFDNRSSLEEDVYFVDGVHDDILTSLAKIGSLKVISRTSVEQYRDTEKTIRQIGEELGVSSVLEGGIQRAGDRIRVNVQLIDVATDAHQWAETYDRELTTSNIFAIQSEIAGTIAVALQATLSPAEQDRISVVPTESLPAYEAYLLGNQRLRERGLAVEQAVEYFQDAIELDPDFALAYVGLADSYQLMRTHTSRRWDELRPLALAAAEKAIELDPNLGEAQFSMAMIHHESREENLAAPFFERGLALSPNYATGRQWYSEFLSRAEENAAALEQIEIASRLDPLSPIINHIHAGRLISVHDYAGAEAKYRKAIEVDPDFARAHQGLAALYFRYLGRLDEAAIYAHRATRLNPDVSSNYALLANILWNLGDIETAEVWSAHAIRLAPDGFDARSAQASILAAKDDWQEAASVAQQGLERVPRAGLFVWIVSTHHLKEGNPEEALAAFTPGFPGLTDEENPDVNRRNIAMSPHVIRVLQVTGETDRASHLLGLATDFYYANLESPIYLGLLTDVHLHALAGETDQALDILQREVESGWRFFALNTFERTATLDAIRNHPRFVAMADQVRTDLARQLESLRQNEPAIFN